MRFEKFHPLSLPITSRLAVLLLILLLARNGFCAEPSDSGTVTEAVVYKFLGGEDGANPFTAGLVAGPRGSFYGTTAGGALHGTGLGAVFELSPPTIPGGSWSHTVLYDFQGDDDGNQPWDGVAMDSSGNLFGTTLRGGK